MNKQQLDEIKARAEAAVIASIPPANLEKVTVMGEFRTHALKDVLALLAEVERLRQEIDEAEKKALDYYVDREEARAEVERLQAENEQLKADINKIVY